MDWEDLHFFNPHAKIRFTKNRLPHWQQQVAVYFVTFHLADSLPTTLLKQWDYERTIWLKLHPKPWSQAVLMEYHKRFSAEMESWLDAGYGSCLLRQPQCAAILAEGLTFFDAIRYEHIAWIVMPNHVHGLFAARAGWPLENVIQSWKRFSARRINDHLGRSGPLWHKDYFDRLIRDRGHLANCIRYIRKNPKKAGIGMGEFVHYENDFARGIE